MTEKSDVVGRLKAAREFVRGNTSTEYLLVHKGDSGPRVRSLEFRKVVQREFEELVADVITRYVDSVRDGSLAVRDLSAINTVTDESTLQHASVRDLPVTELFRALSANRDYPAAKYDRDDPPDFQLVRVSDGRKVLIGVQNHQSLKTYDASRNGISLLYNNDVYTKFEGDVLVVPESLDALYYDGRVYVRKPKSFERLFEMREEYERTARAVIDNFHDSGITFADDRIVDDWMVDGDIRVLRKLYTVYENEIPEYATPENVQRVVDKYDLDVSCRKRNGRLELDIDEYYDIWELLRLLNSDYAEAELIPDARLEIKSKRVIRD